MRVIAQKWLDDNKLVSKQVKRNQRRRPRRFRRKRLEITKKSKLDEHTEIADNQPSNTSSSLLHDGKSNDAPCTFKFGVRFYPEDPTQIHDEYSRYLLFLQLRSDLSAARLRAPPATAALLCSFVLQGKLNMSSYGCSYDNAKLRLN